VKCAGFTRRHHMRRDDVSARSLPCRGYRRDARAHACAPFAALVSTTQAGLYGTHLPTVLKDEGTFGTIECHLSRVNPHWKDLAEGGEAMMIFQGPDGYITPNWYATKAATGKAVPTWNYAILHAYGRPEVMKEKHWLLATSRSFPTNRKRSEPHPWKVSDAPASYIDVMLRSIVGFPLRDHPSRRQVEE